MLPRSSPLPAKQVSWGVSTQVPVGEHCLFVSAWHACYTAVYITSSYAALGSVCTNMITRFSCPCINETGI